MLVSALGQALIWSCDFEQPISNCFEARNTSASHNCKIVPCTNVETITHCLQVRNRTFDGDCFSKPIPNPVDPTNPTDFIVVECRYMPVRHPHNQKYSAGLFFGYLEETGSYQPVNWVALSRIPGALDSSLLTNYSFMLEDVKDQWSTVRLNIHPTSTMPIRLVLEDYIEALGVSGDFLIDNITVYHSSVCPPLCKVCNAFDSCLACDEPAVLWRGQCLQNACSETLPKLTKDKFVPSYSFGNTYYEIALLIDLAGCFDLKLTLSGNPVVFTESKDKLTFPFGPDIIAFQCVFVQKSNEAGQYDCVFRLTISLKSTTLVVSSVSWTQSFLVDLKNVQASSDLGTKVMMGQFETVDAVVITVKGDAKICSSSDCTSFLINPKIPRNQEFYLLLEITDEGFKNIYYPKLTEAFVMGNGTTIKLPIDYSRVQNRSDGGVVYVLMMPLSVFNGYLALKADLIQKSNKRMLYSENYVVASLIKFEMVPPDAQLLNEYLPFFIIAAVVGFVILFILIGLLCKKFTNTDKRRDPNLLRSSNNNNNNNHSGQ